VLRWSVAVAAAEQPEAEVGVAEEVAEQLVAVAEEVASCPCTDL
jgi:hypothetical protein